MNEHLSAETIESYADGELTKTADGTRRSDRRH